MEYKASDLSSRIDHIDLIPVCNKKLNIIEYEYLLCRLKDNSALNQFDESISGAFFK